ncbi:hypothetical protein ACOQFL_17560 [Actinopolyspora sp. H202]|uniref:hypothetical protein n=1 Tax=Actinopolyspora sp. H202 TaxID=1500456 RepID=UPI003EE7C26D
MELEAELRDRSQVTLEFGESVYEFIDERFLERALTGLARRLYTGWVKQYREAISTTNLNIEPNDQHDSEFEEEMRVVEASVESGDGRIAVSTVGMQDFSATIHPGTVRELSEREFVARVAEVTPALIQRFQAKVAELKVRYYG